MNEGRNLLADEKFFHVFATIYIHQFYLARIFGGKWSRIMVLKKLYLQTHVTALCTVEPHFLLEGVYKMK
jgi:hypothetical protein